MYRVLIVEDSEDIRELLRVAFSNAGFWCVMAEDAKECYEKLKVSRQELPDIIILDINLPDVSGWDICKRLKNEKATKNIPVVMITGEYKTSLDVIHGFQHGVDDFVTKPFNVQILVARAQAILRRTTGYGFVKSGSKGSLAISDDVIYSSGKKIAVDIAKRTVSVKNGSGSYKMVDVTPKEYELLCLFLRKPNQVLSKKLLYETVWKEEYNEQSRTLEKHIETLRNKLGKLSESIVTVQGIGYEFVNE